MGFNDVVGLANNIIGNIKTGNNIGEEIPLIDYETEAKKWWIEKYFQKKKIINNFINRNYSTAVMMELLLKTYELKSPIFSFGRNLGMNLLNNIPELKKMAS